MFSFFRFHKGRSYDAPGAGADGLALLKPQTEPRVDGFNTRNYAVLGCLAPTSLAYNKETRQFSQVDLTGNGLFSQGQLELQKLAQLQGN